MLLCLLFTIVFRDSCSSSWLYFENWSRVAALNQGRLGGKWILFHIILCFRYISWDYLFLNRSQMLFQLLVVRQLMLVYGLFVLLTSGIICYCWNWCIPLGLFLLIISFCTNEILTIDLSFKHIEFPIVWGILHVNVACNSINHT